MKQLAKDLEKIKKSIDNFQKKYQDKLANEFALYVVVALIRERGIFLDKVVYDLNELSINALSIEKQIIAERLADKYKIRDKVEQKSQEKLIKKQLKEMK